MQVGEVALDGVEACLERPNVAVEVECEDLDDVLTSRELAAEPVLAVRGGLDFALEAAPLAAAEIQFGHGPLPGLGRLGGERFEFGA